MLLHQVVAGQGPSSSTKPNQPPQGKGDGATRAGLEARFYRALYDKLKAPEVRTTETLRTAAELSNCRW